MKTCKRYINKKKDKNMKRYKADIKALRNIASCLPSCFVVNKAETLLLSKDKDQFNRKTTKKLQDKKLR